MRQIILGLFAALAALATALPARAGSLDQLLSGQDLPKLAAPAAPAPAAADSPAAQREWLVLVFINGVNDLGILGFANKSVNDMEKVGSDARVAMVVELGVLGQDGGAGRGLQFQRGSKTYYVTRDADAAAINSPVIFNSDDADMGSAAHLARFVRRGLRKYPAKKVAVILWNHGAGRLGIAYDDVSKNHMEIDQLGAALGQIRTALGRKIDLFATDACLMQMAGVAYEFKDAAEVVVGSEEVIPGDSFPYDKFLAKLAVNPGMGAEQLAAAVVNDYGAYYGAGVTLSAVRSSAQAGFVARLNAWAGAVAGDPKAMALAADGAIVDATQQFAMEDSKDLYDYVGKVGAALPAGHPARAAGRELRKYIKQTLLLRATALPDLPAAHGLAIYIPALRYNSANYEKLAFAADSDWDDFLRLLMEQRLKQP